MIEPGPGEPAFSEKIERRASEILLQEDGEKKGAREFVDLDRLNSWNDKGYDIEFSDDSGKYGTMLVGERHADKEQGQKQVELMRLMKPEYVLHEALSGWIYDPKTKKFQKQEDGPDEEFDPNNHIIDHSNPEVTYGTLALLADLYRSSDEIGFEIVGCDLTPGEKKEVAKALGIKSIIPGTEKEMMRIRDMKMVERILEYQGKSTRPIIVILGNDHGDDICSQHLLEQRGALGYVYIKQKDIGSQERDLQENQEPIELD